MKKLVLSVLAAGLLMPVLTASASYYDCNWQVHQGEPQPGECHMFLNPDESQSSGGNLTPSRNTNTSDDNVNYLTPSGSTGRNTNSGTNSLTPSRSTENSSDDNVNYLTPTGSATDLLEDSTIDDNAPATDPNDFYKEYYKKNVRDYCVRDVCYVLYDYCYDEIHCEAKKDIVNRNEYDPNYDPYDPNYSRNRNNTWNYWINYYITNYYGMPTCDSRYQKCVFRGYHFGGYHNGYWPAQY